jgi:hypothetical protein
MGGGALALSKYAAASRILWASWANKSSNAGEGVEGLEEETVNCCCCSTMTPGEAGKMSGAIFVLLGI